MKVQVLRKKSNSSNFGTRNAFCGPHSSLPPPHNDDDDSSLGSDDEEINYEIVEKFIRTFHNCDLDDEIEAAFSFDRGATLPVRHTQASYHKPDNWRERNRIGLEKVKEQLENIGCLIPKPSVCI